MNKKLKIINLSNQDINYASGVVPYTFHQEFIKKHSSFLFVHYTEGKSDNLISYHSKYSFLLSRFTKRVISKLQRLISTPITIGDYHFFMLDKTKKILNVDKILSKCPDPDLIIVYFLNSFVSISDLKDLQVKTNAPIFLFLMDMENLTGGCHYSWDCMGYLKECNNCPAFVNLHNQYLASNNLRHYIDIVKEMNITILAPSEQLYYQSKQSTIFKSKHIEKLLIGIDHNIFNKKNKIELRHKHNIPIEKFVILFGAVMTDEKRKGSKYLFEALEFLKSMISVKDIIVLQIGGNSTKDKRLNEYDFLAKEFISSNQILAEIYNIADVLVVPSIQDSGPMMINQSISCGTPVVAFKIGVTTDLIINAQTGYIAEVYDSFVLADGIRKIYQLSPEEQNTISQNCIEIAKEKLNIRTQAEKIINLFLNN